MICGNCEQNCPAYGAECSGCPGCGRLLLECEKERRPCAKCNLFCPDRPEAWRYVSEEIGGSFSLLPERGVLLPKIEIPAYVPLVTAPLQEECPDDVEWVAVHGGKVRREVWRGEMSVHEQFRLPSGKKVALYWFVKDPYLEKFWTNRSVYMPVLREFDAVFAPNFSVYEDAPRIEHLVNMKRSAVSLLEMAEAGVKVIPDVTWYRREDMDRWLELLDLVGAETAAFSMQVVGRLKGCSAWQSYLVGLRYFARRFKGRIVLVGANSMKKLSEAFRAAGRPLSVIDTKSFVTARKGKLLGLDGRTVREEDGRRVPRSLLFSANIRNMREMIKDLRSLYETYSEEREGASCATTRSA